MAQPYIGEIRMFAGTFAPAGWEFCEGQVLSIAEYFFLFEVIGTTYGGDGVETFALPDLRGRIPIHQGNSFIVGEMDGVETVTLTSNQIPAHTHALLASPQSATETTPSSTVVPASPAPTVYSPRTPITTLSPIMVGVMGGNQPHNNLQPYLCINFIISLYGLVPSTI